MPPRVQPSALPRNFLYDDIQPVRATLMQAHWKILRNPDNPTLVAFRFLGKFGGGNCKTMIELQCTQYVNSEIQPTADGEKRVMYEKQFLSDIANPNYSEYESFKSNLSLDGKFFTLTKRQSEKFLKVAAGAFAKDFREPFLAKSRQVNTAIFSKKCKDSLVSITHTVPLLSMENPKVGLDNNTLTYLPTVYYECVVFSLLLEYMPSSEQRINCCSKAYELLRPEGILIIITSDSDHVGRNAALMKNWRYTLNCLGFMRIRFEKLPHITYLVYRASERWSILHKESNVTFSLKIEQDNKSKTLAVPS
ncbi:hypothetical protein GQX74_014899 [Glossina fuscipes]|nr:hypothetical protein GQX74_014899 [Glossina fuscipes]